jgi:hypothetical protein
VAHWKKNIQGEVTGKMGVYDVDPKGCVWVERISSLRPGLGGGCPGPFLDRPLIFPSEALALKKDKKGRGSFVKNPQCKRGSVSFSQERKLGWGGYEWCNFQLRNHFNLKHHHSMG